MLRSEAAGRVHGVSELLFGSDGGARTVADLTSRSRGAVVVGDLQFPEASEGDGGEGDAAFEPAADVEVDQRELELCLSSATAREEGRELARGEYEVELTSGLAEERRKVDRIRLEFARDRQRFFAAAESQVVRLALAVAERVLSREVASDGLHLRATVKAALGRVQDSSATTLRVPVEEVEGWTALLQRESAGKVKVVGDERMNRGDCVLETTVGKVEMGVNVQLAEIERGFSGMLQVQEPDKCAPKADANERDEAVERRGAASDEGLVEGEIHWERG